MKFDAISLFLLRLTATIVLSVLILMGGGVGTRPNYLGDEIEEKNLTII